jgi:hypothetical protein
LRSRSGSQSRSLRGAFFGFLLRFGGRFCPRFRFRHALNLLAHFFRDVSRDRTRVRLLFRNTIAGQKVNDSLRFDLEFAGQLINSNLICFAH